MQVQCKFDNAKNITLESYLNVYGITDIKEFLNPTEKYLDNCLNYKDMNKAVAWLNEVCKNENGKVAVLCDPDVDGIISSSLAYMFLKIFSYNDIDIVCHTKKQHGLKDVHEKLKKYDYVWIPDAGTNDDYYCTYLTSCGVKVLITDHHQAEHTNETAIVINNQVSDKIVNKSLCGTGVTFQTIKAWCLAHNSDWYLDKLDMVAVANIADSMSMANYENRAFNKFGLSNINNPFLKAMIAKWVQNDIVTPKDIAWSIAPKLNALCRSDMQELKPKVVKAFANIITNYDDILSELEQCHKLQSKIVKKAYGDIISEPPYIAGGVVFKRIPSMRYTGLVANKLMDYYNRPIVLVSESKDNKRLQGSVRSTVPLRKVMAESNLLDVCTGHEHAYGVEFKIDKTNDLLNYITNLDLDINPVENVTCSVDNIIQIPQELYEFSKIYSDLWGNDIPEPTIHLKDIVIANKDIRELGTSTIKFKVGMTDIVKFMCSKDFKKELFLDSQENVKLKLNIIGTPSLNEWNGNVYKQIVVDKIEIERV